ncbi:nucleolin 1 [Cucumis melo var. makuwa]|uniref:Nucleolin 1 n=1 Tax=Cucumis melo var. makuwa TaxID=1194695 RepID=A0A5A7T1L8_CUCMM|nr:nucleolin 1 [Cucumis melo var. makuwa]
MEIAGEDGSKLILREPVTIFGRGSGFASKDRTISRRHILIEAKTSDNTNGAPMEPKVSFEVIGRNPIWVRSSKNGEIRTFRRSEKGKMAPGESFCVGGQEPIWFELNKITEFEEGKLVSSRSSDSDDIDVSGIDPVKEFGFLVMGHEFECYGNRVIRDVKKWDWFLDGPSKDSHDDDEDYERKKKRGVRGKRKKGANSDDEDWTDENEDAVQMITKVQKSQRPKYSTRSKDRNKISNDQRKAAKSNKDYDGEVEEDEDDETLGGFIVDDEVDNVEQMDEDEEEEFLDDEDDEED